MSMIWQKALNSGVLLGVLLPYYIDGNAGSNSANASSISWSHTTTADTTCLVVGTQVGNSGNTASVSGVTYNGVSLTMVQRSAAATQGQGGLWVLFNPPIGTYTITMSANDGNRGISGSSANFGGATAVNASVNGNTAINNPRTITLTSTARGLPVGNKHIGGNNGTLHTVSTTDPSGMTLAATANRFTSNSFAKYQGLFYSPTLVNAGSVGFKAQVTAGTIAGSSQQFMILV